MNEIPWVHNDNQLKESQKRKTVTIHNYFKNSLLLTLVIKGKETFAFQEELHFRVTQ